MNAHKNFLAMLFCVLLSPPLLSQSSLHSGTPETPFTIPPEFREEEVLREINGNRLASTGTRKIKDLKYDWSPEKIIITGPHRKLSTELEQIKETLSLSPVLKHLIPSLTLSNDATLLDLSPLLRTIERLGDAETSSCFEAPLWFYNVQKSVEHDDQRLLDFLNGKMRLKRNFQHQAGSVTILRDKGANGLLTHAYLHLTNVLRLEKRGRRFLIRPQAAIHSDYKKTMRNTPNSDTYKFWEDLKDKTQNSLKKTTYTPL